MTDERDARDRIITLEVRMDESDKRQSRAEQRSEALGMELKGLLRETQDKLGSEIRDLKVMHAADTERAATVMEKITLSVDGLRVAHSKAQGGGMLLGWLASFFGGGGATFLIERLFRSG